MFPCWLKGFCYRHGEGKPLYNRRHKKCPQVRGSAGILEEKAVTVQFKFKAIKKMCQ